MATDNLAYSGTSPLHVSIISDSQNQRTSFKRILEETYAQVIEESSFTNFTLDTQKSRCDVILVDLDNVNDESMDKLDDLLDQNIIPALFNEGSHIPAQQGPIRKAWAENLVKKLHDLVQSEAKPKTITPNAPVAKPTVKPPAAMQPQQTKTTQTANIKKVSTANSKSQFPRVAIVAKSKTRMSAIKLTLTQLGVETVLERDFSNANLQELARKVDIVILDQHNIGPVEASCFYSLTRQSHIQHIVCNSSRIPEQTAIRVEWGKKLLTKIQLLCESKSAKLKHNTHQPEARPANNSAIISPKPAKAPTTISRASRVDDVLADVRASLRSIEDAQSRNDLKRPNIPQAQTATKNTPVRQKPSGIPPILTQTPQGDISKEIIQRVNQQRSVQSKQEDVPKPRPKQHPQNTQRGDSINPQEDPLMDEQQSEFVDSVLSNADMAFGTVWDFLVDGKEHPTQNTKDVKKSAFFKELQSLKDDLDHLS